MLGLEKAMAAHSSTPAWEIPWMEEPGRLQSMGRPEKSDTTEWLHFHLHFRALEKEMANHASVLAWRIPGTGESGGLPSMGSHRVRHDWSDLAAAATSGYCDHIGYLNYSNPATDHMVSSGSLCKWGTEWERR